MTSLFLGSDHAGFPLKQKIKDHLSKHNIPFKDMGCESPDSCDYPDFGFAVAHAIQKEPESLGILICGSGVGMSIAANKVPGIRAVLANSEEIAVLGRQHNGAQVLTLGERTPFIDDPINIVDAFLSTDIDMSERHERRRQKLDTV